MNLVLLLSPILIPVVGALVLMLLDAFQKEEGGLAMPTALIHFTAAAMALALWKHGLPADVSALHGYLTIDKVSLFLDATIALGGAIASLLAGGYLAEHKLDRGEYYPLITFSTAGAMMLVSASDVLMLFLGLETMSLGVYAMTGFRRGSPRSAEAAMKYFLLGSFAAALLLFGSALLYVLTGHTDYAGIASVLHDAAAQTAADATAAAQQTTRARVGIFAMLLVLVSMAFKVGAVPFHMWTPDVYQGAPTPVTGFMAAGTKAAAFGAILRFVYVGVDRAAWDWRPALVVVAALTMIVGAVLSVTQTDMKRLLAYSSIAHAGFILVGVLSMERAGVSGVLFYLAAYGLTTIAAFAIVGLVREGGSEATHLSQWTGLGKRHPWTAGVFAFLLLAFAGIPLTSGFTAKFAVFKPALESGTAGAVLVVLGLLCSAITVFVYVRIIVLMYFTDSPGDSVAVVQPSVFTTVTVATGTLFTLVLGVAPASVLVLAERASQFIR